MSGHVLVKNSDCNVFNNKNSISSIEGVKKIMKTLSAHKTRSIIEKTIIESLFVKGEGTLSVITALKKLNAVQLSNNTFILYGCKITVSEENENNYTVTVMKDKDYKKANTLQIIGRRWFQETYGNTYHAVKVYVNDEILIKDFCYGYGNQYLQTAIELLQKAGYNINTFSDLRQIEGFAENVTDVSRKKDLMF